VLWIQSLAFERRLLVRITEVQFRVISRRRLVFAAAVFVHSLKTPQSSFQPKAAIEAGS